jgi:gliding motility-associated-like protein
MMFRSFLAVLLLAGLLVPTRTVGQACLTSWTVTASTPPVNGTYACGQTVTFCFTVTGWNQTNVNWFHGIEANFGPGWDLSTLVPGTPPATCSATAGQWGYYNSVQGTSFFTNIGPQGPGFFFDNPVDGNPGNNFGDNCNGAVNWQFCWTISVRSGAACVSGTSLSVTFDTFSDSQTGSWSGSGCNNDPIVPAPPAVIGATCTVNAGTGASVSACSTSQAISLFSLLTGTPDVGGTWTAPGGAPSSGIFDPTTDVGGAYTYTVTSAAPPCTSQAVVNVTLLQQPNAGNNGSITVCASDAPVNLFTQLGGTPSAGGTWTSPGGGAFSGIFTPAVDAGGTYTYSFPANAPCAAASATVQVTLNPTPTAGLDGTITFCSTSGPASLFNTLGGTPDAGGTWTGPNGGAFSGTYTPGSDVPGNYVYAVAGVAPCPGSTATVTVIENVQPVAGTSASASLCSTEGAADLFTLLEGTPAASGTWSGPGGTASDGTFVPGTSADGVYTYTVSASSPCVPSSATVTVTTTQAFSAGIDTEVDICANSSAVNIFNLLQGSPDQGGVWTLASGFSSLGPLLTPGFFETGPYTYTIEVNGPCPAVSAVLFITFVPASDAGANGTVSLCSSSAPYSLITGLLGTPDTGGTWTGPTGQVHGPTFTPGTDAPGVYTYTVSATAPCTTATSTLTVSVAQAPDAGIGGPIALCEDEPSLDPFTWLSGTPDATGTWAAPNGTPITTVDPSTAQSGNYTYTVAGTTPCPSAQSVVALSVSPLPNAGVNATLSGCADAASFNLLNLLGPQAGTGGTWTGPDGPASATFIPGVDTPGEYTYTVAGTGACIGRSASASVDVTVFPLPQPTFTADPARGCAPLTVQFTATGLVGQPDVVWNFGDGTSSTLFPLAQHTYVGGGSFGVTLSVTDANGCSATVSVPGAVFASNGPSAAFTASPQRVSVEVPVFTVTHNARPDVLYEWTVDDAPIAGGSSFQHIIDPPEIGIHTICLVATDTLGCSNEQCGIILLEDGLNIHVPNAFTPDGDGINDTFRPVVLNTRDESYSLTIFDRWGAEVFTTKALDQGWNGAFRNQGEVLPTGVYAWRLIAQDIFTADRREIIGSVTLLK